jgi:hypothetical protein
LAQYHVESFKEIIFFGVGVGLDIKKEFKVKAGLKKEFDSVLVAYLNLRRIWN